MRQLIIASVTLIVLTAASSILAVRGQSQPVYESELWPNSTKAAVPPPAPYCGVSAVCAPRMPGARVISL
jgi:hypothetical protein